MSTTFRALIDRYVHAYNAGRLDELMSFFAPDAVLVPADLPGVRGHAAIRKHLAAVVGAHVTIVSLDLQVFIAVGEVVVQRGNYRRRVPTRDEGMGEQFGTCEAIWRRQSDGEFRFTALQFTLAARAVTE